MIPYDLKTRLLGWFASGGSRNSSAKTLASAGAGFAIMRPVHPKNPRDFNCCLLLLRAIPELRGLLSTRVAVLSQPWAALVAEWEDIEAMFLDEAGLDFSKKSRAPATLALINKILNDDSARAFTDPNHLGGQPRG